jgi:hypothetical protein
MITEDDLRASLRALERLAPDPAPVAARIAAGVRTQGRRRTAVMVAAAAATAVAVAVPIGMLGRDTGPTAGPATAAPAPATTSPVPARRSPLTVPFTVGWVPAGWRAGLTETRLDGDRRTYEGPRSTDQLLVDVQFGKRSAGTGVTRTIENLGTVVVRGSPDETVQRRVLASVRPADERLTFPFRLTWVPAGYLPVAAYSGLRHWIGDAAGNLNAATPALADSSLSFDSRRTLPGRLYIGVSSQSDQLAMQGLTPNGTFLGRPSRYTDKAGFAVLIVYGLRGADLSITADTRGRPELTRAALERIMAGLRVAADPGDPATWTADPLP